MSRKTKTSIYLNGLAPQLLVIALPSALLLIFSLTIILRSHLKYIVDSHTWFQLHKNPCHVKKAGQAIAQDIPTDRFIQLTEGDQISLMCAYAYAVDFKDINSAQPPKFRARSSEILFYKNIWKSDKSVFSFEY